MALLKEKNMNKMMNERPSLLLVNFAICNNNEHGARLVPSLEKEFEKRKGE